ncbi:MAG: recombinase family protein [Spirochaetales bacterium]|nr:recombinase family protein [Spirochaetales bacterium]
MSQVHKEQSTMAKDLTVISRKTREKEQNKTIRVAAYCRVSTDLECQRSSLENQMELFRHRIKNHPGWELCGIYVDKGLTGTSSKVRPDFQRMIADAEAGKIDYIITKSISRFARNTVDLLNYVRRLRDVGVGVFFEEQKLDTGTLFSEMLLTIHGAFAQEESHSISENLKSGKRKRYAMGIPQWFAVYGYRKGERKGEWEIVEEEADVIRLIFDMYVRGRSLPQICAFLNGSGIICRRRGVWEPTTLSGILHNEKYVGDVIMQKLYVPSLLSRNAVKNDGSVLPRYYLQDHHPAIIDRQTFLDAQITALLKDYHRGSHQYPYLSFLRCPFCGERMIAVSLPRNKHGIAWTCGGPASGKVLRSERTSCPPFFVKTKYIDRAVLRAFSELVSPNVPVPETVEYGFLRENVSMITFARCDERVLFDELLIIWADGRQSVVEIEYEKPSEFPVAFPEFLDGQYYADGIPMGRFGGTSRNIYVGRLISMDFCSKVRIYDNPRQEICPGNPEFGTMDIPVVIAPDSTKKEAKENE